MADSVKQWPSPTELENKSEEALQSLRIKRIEFLGEDFWLNQLRFTLSDGSITPMREGVPEPDHGYFIDEKVQIKKIRLA